MALPPRKGIGHPLDGMHDIKSTNLNKTLILLSPKILLEQDKFFFKVTRQSLGELNNIAGYTKHWVNLEVLPDDIMRKTDIEYQQGETIYIRMEDDPPAQFFDSPEDADKIRALPFFVFKKDFDLNLTFPELPTYVLTNALTKNSAYPMRRFYCVRNDYYYNSLLGITDDQ